MSETTTAAKLSFLQGYTKSNTLNSLHPSIILVKRTLLQKNIKIVLPCLKNVIKFKYLEIT